MSFTGLPARLEHREEKNAVIIVTLTPCDPEGWRDFAWERRCVLSCHLLSPAGWAARGPRAPALLPASLRHLLCTQPAACPSETFLGVLG